MRDFILREIGCVVARLRGMGYVPCDKHHLLSTGRHGNGKRRGEAFTVGLMHAIGELVMHAGMPAAMLQLDQQSSPMDDDRLALEERTFGYQFASVGSELARQ